MSAAEIIAIDGKPVRTPGIYPSIPNDVYHKDTEWISSSQLKVGLGSPHYYKYFVLDGKGKKEETKQLAFGSLAHKLILEADDFDSEYAILPFTDLDLRKKADKEKKARFEEENAGKIIVTTDEMERAMACRDSVYAHKDARKLLEQAGGISEASVYVTLQHQLPDGEIVDFKVRVRPDRMVAGPGGFILDLKTAKNVARDPFERDAFGSWRTAQGQLKWGHYSYHYDLSAALYIKALEKLDGERLPFYWVVVKNDAPWETAVYKCSKRRYQDGCDKLNYALNTIIMSERNNSWEFQREMEEI